MLQFESTEQMLSQVWDDYRILKKKKKEGKKNMAPTDLPMAAVAGEKVYSFVSMTRRFKRKSITGYYISPPSPPPPPVEGVQDVGLYRAFPIVV